MSSLASSGSFAGTPAEKRLSGPDILALDPAQLAQPLGEGRDAECGQRIAFGEARQHPDYTQTVFRGRSKRPTGYCVAEQRQHNASVHGVAAGSMNIISSADPECMMDSARSMASP